jgi:subtilisin family serine protease
MLSVELVRLTGLMAATAGEPAVRVGLIDGPVLAGHPGLEPTGLHALNGSIGCEQADSAACLHGTFVAGILHARRGGAAPGLCPGCALVMRPIFAEGAGGGFPTSQPEELAAAIYECVNAEARVLNLSVGLMHVTSGAERALQDALDHAARWGVLVVAASGNQGEIGGSALARHPAVIPVVAAGADGRLINVSNLGGSVGRRGLAAPGDGVESLWSGGGRTRRFSGTSAAAPFVTGAAALLWSLYPTAPAARIRHALIRATGRRRNSIVPPLLDAQAAWETLKAA